MPEKNEPEKNEPEHYASSLVRKQTDHHELIFWDDLVLTIEHYLYQQHLDNTLDHARLNRNEILALRNLLNSKEVKRALGLL
jgi:hypothetical protein